MSSVKMPSRKLLSSVFNNNHELIRDFENLFLEVSELLPDSLTSHVDNLNNPHQTTKVQIGLSDVANALQLVAANNLSDITDTVAARANIGVKALINTLSGASSTVYTNSTTTVSDLSDVIELTPTSLNSTVDVSAVINITISQNAASADSIGYVYLSLIDDNDAELQQIGTQAETQAGQGVSVDVQPSLTLPIYLDGAATKTATGKIRAKVRGAISSTATTIQLNHFKLTAKEYL